MKPKYTLTGARDRILTKHWGGRLAIASLDTFHKANAYAELVSLRYIRFCRVAQSEYLYFTVWVEADAFGPSWFPTA